mgnify:CR=1 FL=1
MTTQYEKGLALLNQLHGGHSGQTIVDTVGKVSPRIVKMGIEWVFGDIMQDPTLDLKTRELTIIACLVPQNVLPQLKAHIEGMAQAAGRPLQYLTSSKDSKEDLARKIAERDGITDGLVCVFSVLETCMAFDVRGNYQTHKKEVVRRQRKCLHYYFYP